MYSVLHRVVTNICEESIEITPQRNGKGETKAQRKCSNLERKIIIASRWFAYGGFLFFFLLQNTSPLKIYKTTEMGQF